MAKDFRTVVDEEIEAIITRRRNTVDPIQDCGLPPLAERSTEQAQESGLLLTLIGDLRTDEQDKAWTDAVSAPVPAMSGEDGGRRNIVRHDGLVGLAFSGGGIRSATFNLGVLEALDRCGLWGCIDYLSTVSGGGYLGSCISSLYARKKQADPGFLAQSWNNMAGTLKRFVSRTLMHSDETEPTQDEADNAGRKTCIDFPFRHVQGVLESAVFRHLRNSANYVAPHGLRDLARGPVVLLRGVVLNILIVLPYLLVAAAVTAMWFDDIDQLYNGWLGNKVSLFAGHPFALSAMIALVILICFALYPLARVGAAQSARFDGRDWELRNLSERSLVLMFLLLGGVLLIELQPLAIVGLDWVISELSELKSIGEGGLDWEAISAVFGAASTLAAAFFGAALARRSTRLTGQIGLYLLAAAGFVLFWLVYLNLSRWAISYILPGWVTTVFDFVPGLIRLALPQSLEALVPSLQLRTLDSAYVVMAVILWLYALWFFDMNYISLHNFYRDRLSRAYLIRFAERSGRLEHNDTQKLSGLDENCVPYHLINAAINVKDPDEAHRRGRQADSFFFSKLSIGGPETGYCDTEEMESVRPHVNLGTAMAVSGAAFAATAGKATIRPLTFILAMLNVRLNYWLPNPQFVDSQLWKLGFRLIGSVGPIYLLRELLGSLDSNSWNVDISDGGHFENLGVYELLRRECRFIIVGDGECDPQLRFEALSELVRLAQIDMGIGIEIEGLDNIRAGLQHHAIGTIHYSGERIGKLLYIKSSLLKDDNLEASLNSPEAYLSSPRRQDNRQYDAGPYIAHYKSKHPDFPHQTTADQFFDERQFECYRALGYVVTMRTIGDWNTPP